MLHILLQIARTGIKTEPKPSPAAEMVVVARLQEEILRTLGRALTIRHADMLLVTGPVSKHMAIALKRTYEATPDPKLVVAVGDCGCTGGIFGESYATCGRVANVIPVDVAIPGCPPTPTALLEGILAAITTAAPQPQRAEPGLRDQ